MAKIDTKKIAEFYNNIESVWDEKDPWQQYSKYFIQEKISLINWGSYSRILNAGSAGNAYGIDENKTIHVDIAEAKIAGKNNAYVASVESMPFKDNYFDAIICVGSVINYCDLVTTIKEFARVLNNEGILILEYESSFGFEYYNEDYYMSNACIVSIPYIHVSHKQWLFSPDYIYATLQNMGFIVQKDYPFHILDGIIYRWIPEEQSVRLTHLDRIISIIPFFSRHANNHFLICKKVNPSL